MFGGSKTEAAAPAPAAPGAAAPGAAAPKKGCCAGCCDCCGPKNEPEWGMAPPEKRKCRDVFCCLLFAAFWIGMVVVGAIGIRFGNWMRLVYGVDYKGQTCGSDSAVANRPYTVYPRTNEDMLANVRTAAIKGGAAEPSSGVAGFTEARAGYSCGRAHAARRKASRARHCPAPSRRSPVLMF